MRIIDKLDVNEYELDARLLDMLLTDKTTGDTIRWCTDGYRSLGDGYAAYDMMTRDSVTAGSAAVVMPRAAKPVEEQLRRTRVNAEVFTPAWVCNVQNNAVDDAWFGRPFVFNIPRGQTWIPTRRRVVFNDGRTWTGYVDERVLEVTCGEAPYLTSRYDAVTGSLIPVRERIGLLDRKLRVVAENAADDAEWLKWSLRAFESSYGYDYQGDSVLLARENLLATYCDAFAERFGRRPTAAELRRVANVIAWNIWQMDGSDSTVPYAFTEVPKPHSAIGLFDAQLDEPATMRVPVKAKVYDWRARRPETFESTMTGRN
ncbi:restriction endonuclease subunit M [Bifidobacterium parmae]|uniref:Restriction endonuclease subunit M n=1 Tax=Bifidobacterium parmae TaxID=361854 RepID=A0A2N5J4L4_9BIFI|nr:restriction endonuclease subunit M [Bifidobacterium parmae]PLS29156.1 restriction endonuclease subunit M [Bifidobacterium parmae]